MKIGAARKIDEYVPTTSPTRRAVAPRALASAAARIDLA